jgi:hypothetical protein
MYVIEPFNFKSFDGFQGMESTWNEVLAFFGGDQQAVLEYYFLYKSVFKIFLYGHNIVDDDQSIATMCFYERPTLFNLVHGGWHGVIKLFSWNDL